nr:2,4-dichlorophenol 6-monooxygenase [Quercus suber]
MTSINTPDNGTTIPMEAIETTYLIIGAGPAGASLAAFLASYGETGIMISAASGTAKEPRAHITNAAALECLRDIGLEAECRRNATHGENMHHTRWCYSIAGEEFARIHSWGNQPDRQGEYFAASPCRHVDLPQTLLEPIVVREAVNKGWKVRFDTSLVRYERESPESLITSTVRDDLSGQTYTIHSKYLLGCDGARSQVMRQLQIPLQREPGQGLAINIHAKADLTRHMKHRQGNLHWIFQPDRQHTPWGWCCVLRMVKPWHEWMFILLPEPGFKEFSVLPSHAEFLEQMRLWVGDDTVALEIIDVAKWNINEIVAERYSDGNIFCLGDAVHRHPPFNGLGSNTCIQDAYNLAWKLAYVERGLASPLLLDSFSVERQPIGAGVVQRANQGLRDYGPLFEALGVLPSDLEERRRQFAELGAATPAGRERRAKLNAAVQYSEHEFGGIGIEMNQRYDSHAVYTADETKPRPAPPADPVLEHEISTFPGSRLPHAWVNRRTPEDAPISTHDLAGHGAFSLITGIGGEQWKKVSRRVAEELGIVITVASIGWGQDWEDVYGDWVNRREVDEDGCVLVRPDRTICWRSMGMREDAADALRKALKAVLSRNI